MFSVLSLIKQKLVEEIDADFEHPFDLLVSAFIKQVKTLTREAPRLPYNDQHFVELLSIGYAMIARKSEIDMDINRDLLKKDVRAFFKEVQGQQQEKHAASGGVPSILFESKLLTENGLSIGVKPVESFKIERKPNKKTETKQKSEREVAVVQKTE